MDQWSANCDQGTWTKFICSTDKKYIFFLGTEINDVFINEN